MLRHSTAGAWLLSAPVAANSTSRTQWLFWRKENRVEGMPA